MNDLQALIADYADVSDPDGEPICVWERVSTDMTRQEIASQTRDLKIFIKAGLYRVVRVFRFAASAYHGEHKGQQEEMLADIAAGLYKVVVSAMTSRYERQGWQQAMYIGLKLHLEYGARVVAIDDPNYGDMSTELGGIGTMLKAKSNHDYSASMSYNVLQEFRLMDERGAFRGHIPGGYTTTGPDNNKQLVHHPFAADIVAQAIRDFPAKGGSLAKVVRTFKAANARYNADLEDDQRKLRLPVTSTGVAEMLRREVYSTGRYLVHRADGTVYIYQAQPLVTVPEQQAAIAALEGRRRGDDVKSRAISKEDFSGAVWCAEHGNGQRGRGYRNYAGKRKKDGTLVRKRRYLFQCCGKSVQAGPVDEAIHEIMGGNMMAWYVPFRSDPNAERDRQLDIIERTLAELPARRLPEDAEDAERARLRAERKRLQSIADQPAVTYGRPKTADDGTVLTEGDRWRMMSPAEQRDHLTSGNFYVLVRSAGDRSGRVIVTIDEPGYEGDSDLVA